MDQGMKWEGGGIHTEIEVAQVLAGQTAPSPRQEPGNTSLGLLLLQGQPPGAQPQWASRRHHSAHSLDTSPLPQGSRVVAPNGRAAAPCLQAAAGEQSRGHGEK